MSLRIVLWVGSCVLGVALTAPRAVARVGEQETVRRAAAALEQIMATPAAGIPQQLLSGAQAMVIVPQMKGGAFIVGIRKGRGVLVVREADGTWRAPQFVEITGGSLGWQAGVQSSDLFLVFRSRESLDNLMQGKLTIGADASVAAGPVGRQVAAATDLDLKAEIYSYSRSRGAFVGVSIDGTVLRSDPPRQCSLLSTPRNHAARSRTPDWPTGRLLARDRGGGDFIDGSQRFDGERYFRQAATDRRGRATFPSARSRLARILGTTERTLSNRTDRRAALHGSRRGIAALRVGGRQRAVRGIGGPTRISTSARATAESGFCSVADRRSDPTSAPRRWIARRTAVSALTTTDIGRWPVV